MTVLWIAIGLISLSVAAVIFRRLDRADGTGLPERAGFDLSVYEDQLAEVDRDLRRGVLDEDQAGAAKTEIERRILTLADAAERDAAPSAARSGRVSPLAIGLALAAPSAALGIYAALGSPQAPNVPYAQRDIPAEIRQADERRRIQEMDGLAERLATRLETEPGNVRGWILLGRSYAAMGRLEDAISAMQRAYGLAPDDPNVLIQYAETLIPGQNNAITDDIRALFNRALALDPRNPRARYYLALAKAQADDVRGAIQDWVDLTAISPPNAPWLTTVRPQIIAASKELGVDPDSFKPSAAALAMGPPPDTPAIPGPSREDVEAASRMSAQDRTAMIRGMVQRLADRLAENPDDAEGWRRLAGAYRVLGEEAKAKDAETRAKAAKK